MLNMYSHNAVLSEWYGISQDTEHNLPPTVFKLLHHSGR